MGKSVIDAIGRTKALTLMENAVFRAIAENSLVDNGQPSPFEMAQHRHEHKPLIKSVPIA